MRQRTSKNSWIGTAGKLLSRPRRRPTNSRSRRPNDKRHRRRKRPHGRLKTTRWSGFGCSEQKYWPRKTTSWSSALPPPPRFRSPLRRPLLAHVLLRPPPTTRTLQPVAVQAPPAAHVAPALPVAAAAAPRHRSRSGPPAATGVARSAVAAAVPPPATAVAAAPRRLAVNTPQPPLATSPTAATPPTSLLTSPASRTATTTDASTPTATLYRLLPGRLGMIMAVGEHCPAARVTITGRETLADSWKPRPDYIRPHPPEVRHSLATAGPHFRHGQDSQLWSAEWSDVRRVSSIVPGFSGYSFGVAEPV
ncbi:unnamed protein product [Pylaiella littoralis]